MYQNLCEGQLSLNCALDFIKNFCLIPAGSYPVFDIERIIDNQMKKSELEYGTTQS